jgi:hypothetical protein
MAGAGENGGLLPAPVWSQATRFVNLMLGKVAVFALFETCFAENQF